MGTSKDPPAAMASRVECTPGTFLLVDTRGETQQTHAHGTGANRDIVLVPAPSSHPDDPLNWSPRRKKLSALCMAAYVLVVGICSSSLYSTLDPLSNATGLSYDTLNSGTGYMFLLFGWGCVFWQAVAVQFGKRPVYLVTLAGTLGVMVWQPHIRSNGAWIAAKILQGFFGAPMESIAEVTVSDVFFTHERGRYMALYALALGYSNGIAPLITGFINDGLGYEWVFYWCAIFCGVAFILVFICMEETKFTRTVYLEGQSTSNEPTCSKGEENAAGASSGRKDPKARRATPSTHDRENQPSPDEKALPRQTQAHRKHRVPPPKPPLALDARAVPAPPLPDHRLRRPAVRMQHRMADLPQRNRVNGPFAATLQYVHFKRGIDLHCAAGWHNPCSMLHRPPRRPPHHRPLPPPRRPLPSRVPPLAVPPLSPPNPLRLHPLRRRRSPPNPLVRDRVRHGRHLVHNNRGLPDCRCVLHRLLQGAGRRGAGRCDCDSEYDGVWDGVCGHPVGCEHGLPECLYPGGVSWAGAQSDDLPCA
ncbi:uncharacterized protein DSM5745_03252 [Aspergillus mulundensis]|uniref:Major facilitator superfamily (MFS) profile domain-containing protein n=1 Tax=Aspergillus mulundensis TaxID=1810919 RepID=A0A3D8SJV8_9EURO|nr:hypothetical protein DSM5745_03252 [Aspergillus mulundensis]RDW86610.1 hypothetical protein DSM5745_03252 [Aspergillus mulundensis]